MTNLAGSDSMRIPGMVRATIPEWRSLGNPLAGAASLYCHRSNLRVSTCGATSRRTWAGARASGRRSGFILLLVLVVVAMASLAALTFSRSMLITHEASRISSGQLQTRMCAESGAQAVRLMLAYPRNEREAMGGVWNNAAMFQAINVIPDGDPARRAHYTIVSPSLDENGNYTGLRYGLQNESAKLNLNTLAQLDALASAGTLGASAAGGGGAGGGGAAGGAGGAAASGVSAMASLASAASSSMSSSMSSGMLMALPGMTEEIADAILDWLDADDEPRPLGAEFDDYYLNLPNPYKPANGPIESIEQLLLVRGVTPLLLFGYDVNRNGVLDQSESTQMSRGTQAGMAPGAMSSDPNAVPPPPLGWAPYLTLQSMEKNIASDGTARVNINSDDMQLLSEELSAVIQNEDWRNFILAYRYGGSPGGGGTSPLMALASMAATDSEVTDGAMGAQLQSLSAATDTANSPESGAAAAGGGNPPQPWTSSAMESIDLTQAGSVQFNQVLDLFDATVTLEGPNGSVTYSSPLSSLPLDMANSTPQLMDYLTTVDAEAIPGRINIMECPQEILRGVPGLTDEVVDQILEARVDGSDSETRQFETWLAVEGILTIAEMRAIMPLVTCGGDVYKAQIVGYIEGGAAFSRIEAIISGAGEVPNILFFRRMDHLGRSFDIPTLGQRFDARLGGGF